MCSTSSLKYTFNKSYLFQILQSYNSLLHQGKEPRTPNITRVTLEFRSPQTVTTIQLYIINYSSLWPSQSQCNVNQNICRTEQQKQISESVSLNIRSYVSYIICITSLELLVLGKLVAEIK